jgi:hypothetical protein
MVQVLVALQTPALYGLSGAHCRSTSRGAITPSAGAATATAGTLTIRTPASLSLTPIVWAGSVVKTTASPATPDRPDATIITAGVPACSLHRSTRK